MNCARKISRWLRALFAPKPAPESALSDAQRKQVVEEISLASTTGQLRVMHFDNLRQLSKAATIAENAGLMARCNVNRRKKQFKMYIIPRQLFKKL